MPDFLPLWSLSAYKKVVQQQCLNCIPSIKCTESVGRCCFLDAVELITFKTIKLIV